jgi:hypothetical protein
MLVPEPILCSRTLNECWEILKYLSFNLIIRKFFWIKWRTPNRIRSLFFSPTLHEPVVFKLIFLNMTVRWNIPPCCLAEIDRRFWAYCLQHQGDAIRTSPSELAHRPHSEARSSLILVHIGTVGLHPVKVKQSHNTPMRAQRERRYSFYSFTSSVLDGDEWSASRPGRPLPPVPIVQEAGWTPGPVWTQKLEEKSSWLCRGSNLDRPIVQSQPDIVLTELSLLPRAYTPYFS